MQGADEGGQSSLEGGGGGGGQRWPVLLGVGRGQWAGLTAGMEESGPVQAPPTQSSSKPPGQVHQDCRHHEYRQGNGDLHRTDRHDQRAGVTATAKCGGDGHGQGVGVTATAKCGGDGHRAGRTAAANAPASPRF